MFQVDLFYSELKKMTFIHKNLDLSPNPDIDPNHTPNPKS